MNNIALAPAQHSNTHTVDLEAAQPSAHRNGALRPNLNTSLKMAGTGLAFLGAAACLAMDLGNDVAEAEHHDLGRSLLDDNDGCKKGEHRSHLSNAAQARFKWALVGEASAVGLGLIAFPFIRILPSNKYTTALLFPAVLCIPSGVTALVITGFIYGMSKVNNGKCVPDHGSA